MFTLSKFRYEFYDNTLHSYPSFFLFPILIPYPSLSLSLVQQEAKLFAP